jgi:hypothetical protein
MKTFYTPMYYVKSKDLGHRPLETQVHKIRDGLSIMHLASALNRLGYTFGGAILNVPKDRTGTTRLGDSPLCLDDPDVLILQATRPPLHDHVNEPKRHLERSGSDIETSILSAVARFFDSCDREFVRLKDFLVPDSAEADEYRAVRYYQSKGGTINVLGCNSAYEREPDEARLTLGYLLSIPRHCFGDEPGGNPPCRLVICWGMGGTETLYFSLLLGTGTYGPLLANAVHGSKPTLLTTPFLVPDSIPVPLLRVSLSDLKPKKAKNARVVTWTLP